MVPARSKFVCDYAKSAIKKSCFLHTCYIVRTSNSYHAHFTFSLQISSTYFIPNAHSLILKIEKKRYTIRETDSSIISFDDALICTAYTAIKRSRKSRLLIVIAFIARVTHALRQDALRVADSLATRPTGESVDD